MLHIPQIETERLLLRGWREDDLDSFAELRSNAEVTRFIGGPLSRMETWRTICAAIGHWALRGFGVCALERKSDHCFIGYSGLFRPEGWPGMEVVWTLDRPYWGHGYATEAAKASLDYGFQNYTVEKLISLIDPENFSSQKVAERLGETKNGATHA